MNKIKKNKDDLPGMKAEIPGKKRIKVFFSLSAVFFCCFNFFKNQAALYPLARFVFTYTTASLVCLYA